MVITSNAKRLSQNCIILNFLKTKHKIFSISTRNNILAFQVVDKHNERLEKSHFKPTTYKIPTHNSIVRYQMHGRVIYNVRCAFTSLVHETT